VDDHPGDVTPRRRRLSLFCTAGVCLGVLTTGIAFASFDFGSSSGFSVATDRIFPAARTTTAWSVTDASSGSSSDVTFSTAVGEGSYFATKNWSTSFSATRYVDFTLSSPLPGGLTASGVVFNFDFAANAASDTACIYFEVYRASTATLIGTHGSSGSPVQCVTGTGLTHTATALPEVTTSDIANDLLVRVYGDHDASSKMRLDLASVTGSAYAGFNLYPISVGDRSNGTMSTTTWGLAASGDSATLSTGTWPSTFSASQYLTFTFPDEAPTSATVSAASFALSYRAGTNGSNSCWYFEVYDSTGTLLATHGSGGSPISCNSSNSTYQTDTVSLPEVNTGARLNSLKVRVYFSSSGLAAAQLDLAQLSETYALGTGSGCASAGTQTINATGDSWIDENNPAANKGNLTTASVQSRSSSRNRRMLLYFSMPPVPTGCSVTAATLRVYASSVAGSRTIEAWQAASAWNERVVTWTTQPSTTGSAATSANGAGYESWSVTAAVTAMMASGNYGFLLKDSAEGSATTYTQTYLTTEGLSNIPQLDVTFG
jgi:hypothetical protein